MIRLKMAAAAVISFTSLFAADPSTGGNKVTFDKSNIQTLAPNALPVIVSIEPPLAAMEVDPALKEITVTFDRDMGPGYSWTGTGPQFPGKDGSKPEWRDKGTCVLPVQLEAGHFYRFGVNSPSHQNFRSADGMPVRPRAFYFVTKGASEEVKALARKPQLLELNPPNGATDVDPTIKELKATFDMPMAGSASWTGTGPMFPQIPQGKTPIWSADHKTCTLPVELKPGTEYRLGLNSPTRFNFQSTNGIPADPVVYTFKTKP